MNSPKRRRQYWLLQAISLIYVTVVAAVYYGTRYLGVDWVGHLFLDCIIGLGCIVSIWPIILGRPQRNRADDDMTETTPPLTQAVVRRTLLKVLVISSVSIGVLVFVFDTAIAAESRPSVTGLSVGLFAACVSGLLMRPSWRRFRSRLPAQVSDESAGAPR